MSEKHLKVAFAQYFFWDNNMKILQRLSQGFEDCGSGFQHLNHTCVTFWTQIPFVDHDINEAEEVSKLNLGLLKALISTVIMGPLFASYKCAKYIFKHRPL